MKVIGDAGRFSCPPEASNDFVEYLRESRLSAGTYCIPRTGMDDQSPHAEDEIYIVLRGRARIGASGEGEEVGPGSVVYVAAAEEHRFTDITEDLVVVAVFAPPYSG
jgi:quercetin dioxygenase-like cupin family protein